MSLHSSIENRINLFIYSLNETIPLNLYDENLKIMEGAIYIRKRIHEGNYSPAYKVLSTNYSYALISNFYISDHPFLKSMPLELQFSKAYECQCSYLQVLANDYQELLKRYFYFSVPFSQDFLDEEHYLTVAEHYQKIFPDDDKFNGINVVFEGYKNDIEKYYLIKIIEKTNGTGIWLKSRTYDFQNDEVFLEEIKGHIDKDIDIIDIKENLIEWIKYIKLLDY